MPGFFQIERIVSVLFGFVPVFKICPADVGQDCVAGLYLDAAVAAFFDPDLNTGYLLQ